MVGKNIDIATPLIYIGLDKSGYRVNIFLILHKNICCGYS